MELVHDNVEPKAELSYEEYRRDVYKLLSDCYHLPDEQLLENLNSLDINRGQILLNLAEHRPDTSDIDSLIVDYSRLFVGPYQILALPYGSMYMEDKSRIMGDSSIEVKKMYAEEGLDICLKEVPDHIALELEFMYYLVFRQTQAIRMAEYGMAAGYRNKQKVFLETHLGQWVFEFTRNMAEHAQTGFYKNLAEITNSFIRIELENLFINSKSIR